MMASGSLTGIKAVEIAGIGSGLCCGMQLADMGADVILIERKQPSVNAAKVFAENADSSKEIFNRGKGSIAVDLKSGQGVELVVTLIDDADVLIEGFRPGVMERFGLGLDVCLERNPKLRYGRMTGWGQTGPLAHAAGHDTNYMGVSGAMAYATRENQAPVVPLTLVGDVGGAPWNDSYACADGKYITICDLEPRFYQELIQLLKLETSPVFARQWDKKMWPQGKEILQQVFLGKTREQWCELLEGTDACFAPVLNFSEAVKHPHNIVREAGFVEEDIAKLKSDDVI